MRADCHGYKALQATVAYTTVRESLPDEKLDDFALVVNCIGNTFCPTCNHPDCQPGPQGWEAGATETLLAMQTYICSDPLQELYNTVLDIKNPSHLPFTRELLYAQQAEPQDPYALDCANSLAYPTQEPWSTTTTEGVAPQNVYHVDYEDPPSAANTDDDTGSNSSSAS